jgi:hypothetical protein
VSCSSLTVLSFSHSLLLSLLHHRYTAIAVESGRDAVAEIIVYIISAIVMIVMGALGVIFVRLSLMRVCVCVALSLCLSDTLV